jgi:demethylmenaquinone methyltransferase/2-methoxy-6-polyprenyl-1,4-benzoquinol methylase
MLQGAERRKQKLSGLNIALRQQDVLSNTIADNSADCIISVFGLKTFSDDQKRRFAAEIKRILKPQGTFSLIEVSVPPYKPLRVLYMVYLKQIIPILGKLLLGNPETYRMLGIYTEEFGNAKRMEEILSNEGLVVNYHDFFYGCASGLSGLKV